MPQRISLFSIALVILGIMAMVYPPLGLLLLLGAWLNQRHHSATRHKLYGAAYAKAAEKHRRARILAAKSLS